MWHNRQFYLNCGWYWARNVAKPSVSSHSPDSSIKLWGRCTTQTQTSEVRWAACFSDHWVVTSMFASVTPERSWHRQLKKISNGGQLTLYWSYKPHLHFIPTWKFLKILYVSFKGYFWQKLKFLMSVLGLNSNDRKSTRDKANISNPKVNRVCAPLRAYRTSADCVQIWLGPSIPYIPLGVYHTGGFNAMWRCHKPLAKQCWLCLLTHTCVNRPRYPLIQ